MSHPAFRELTKVSKREARPLSAAKIGPIIRDILEMVRENCKLVLFTNRKSYALSLVPKVVTLNGVMAVILHYSPNSAAVVPISSVVEIRPDVCDRKLAKIM